MQVKSFIATVGLGMAAGAAAVLLMPKDSKVYQKANDAVQTLKTETGKMMDSMKR